ncbi:sodium:solute symporter [Nevskia soli]|uniref:sodium:solute symporter n=1 Tax=Nevskia soli TaxID=418856 RepID=UPI0015D799B1|nr:sodium:solute symporter [Nevskia soli]
MRYLDWGVIAAYLLGVTWFGAQFGKRQTGLAEYFLGGRTAPWWAIALSIVSAETSTLTIVGTPALSFRGNFAFLQVVFGYLLARVVISVLFLPAYFRGEMFTAYQLMQRRFGERVRRLTALIFLFTRALAEGVRVFAISIVISIVLGTGEAISVVLIVALTLIYTFEGGMTAVIWTDVLQMGMYVAGAAVSLVVMLGKIPGGWHHAAAVASAAGKFQVLDFRTALNLPYTFWAGLIGGCFLTTASHGTDQLVVQRLLSARNEKESRRALFASWLVVFLQFTLFLVIGVLLWTYYGDYSLKAPQPMDRIYPLFVWENLPIGVRGVVIAAILAAAMANLSAALNSLASTTVVDFVRGVRDERRQMLWARWATVFWGIVLVAIGLVARSWGTVLESGLSIASVTLGLLLGVFLLGVLTSRVGERGAALGVVIGLASILWVRFETSIAFTWWVFIGSTATFLSGYAGSFALRESTSID